MNKVRIGEWLTLLRGSVNVPKPSKMFSGSDFCLVVLPASHELIGKSSKILAAANQPPANCNSASL